MFARGQVLFALGGDVALLEGGPEAVFERAAVVEVVDFEGGGELVPRAGDEDDAAGAAAKDGRGQELQGAEAQAVVVSAAFPTVGFVGEKLAAADAADVQNVGKVADGVAFFGDCLLYTSRCV